MRLHPLEKIAFILFGVVTGWAFWPLVQLAVDRIHDMWPLVLALVGIVFLLVGQQLRLRASRRERIEV